MPNTVVKLTNAESTWLEAAREDRKLLINMKAHLQRCAFCLLLKEICKDVLLLCLHLVQGSRFRVEVAASPPFFYWGNARKWHLSHQLLVTPTIRGKESSHMYGMRSFDSVLTCSGWGFSHIERFCPFRMTIREGGWALIWEICCVFWNYRCYIRYE